LLNVCQHIPSTALSFWVLGNHALKSPLWIRHDVADQAQNRENNMTDEYCYVAEPIELHPFLEFYIKSSLFRILIILTSLTVPLNRVYFMQFEHIDVEETPERGASHHIYRIIS